MRKAPIFYSYLQFKIAEHCERKKVSKDYILKQIFAGFKIPPNLRRHILNELQDYGLLNIESENTIKIINCPFKSEHHLNVEVARFTRRKRAIQTILQ